MAGRKFRVEWDERDRPEALKTAYLSESNSSIRIRLQGLWMLRRGMRIDEVAFTLDVHYRTVHRWISWYRTGGLEEVRTHQQGGKGRRAYLSEESMLSLAREVAAGRFAAVSDAQEWIESEYGVRYTKAGAYSLLRRVV